MIFFFLLFDESSSNENTDGKYEMISANFFIKIILVFEKPLNCFKLFLKKLERTKEREKKKQKHFNFYYFIKPIIFFTKNFETQKRTFIFY